MKTARIVVWVIALLVGAHALTAMIIFPEFHLSDGVTLQKTADGLNKLDKLSPDLRRELGHELFWERGNAGYGIELAVITLLIDVGEVIFLVFLIVLIYTEPKRTEAVR